MICEIAGLGVEIPEIGDLPQRCAPYLADVPVDIVIDGGKMRPDIWPELSPEDNHYLSSGFQFYQQLLSHEGMMLHASAVVVEGWAYLFSGHCGVGKSTHANLYLNRFSDAYIINDDKPALRRVNGSWMVYGTPWCGKDGINRNACAPLAGICFLHQGDRMLKRMTPLEAFGEFLQQTNGRGNAILAGRLMSLTDKLLREIPVFCFTNHAMSGDELLTYEAMHPVNGKEKV